MLRVIRLTEACPVVNIASRRLAWEALLARQEVYFAKIEEHKEVEAAARKQNGRGNYGEAERSSRLFG